MNLDPFKCKCLIAMMLLLLFTACSHSVPMPDRDTIGGAEVGGVAR